jgi:hypothetical protein
MGVGELGLWSTGVCLVDRGSFSGRGTRVKRVKRARRRSRPWKGQWLGVSGGPGLGTAHKRDLPQCNQMIADISQRKAPRDDVLTLLVKKLNWERS